jgi:hypothetical protein
MLVDRIIKLLLLRNACIFSQGLLYREFCQLLGKVNFSRGSLLKRALYVTIDFLFQTEWYEILSLKKLTLMQNGGGQGYNALMTASD